MDFGMGLHRGWVELNLCEFDGISALALTMI